MFILYKPDIQEYSNEAHISIEMVICINKCISEDIKKIYKRTKPEYYLYIRKFH